MLLLLTSEESLSVVIIWVNCAGLTYKFGFALLNPRETLWRSPYNIPSSTYCKSECQIFTLLYELAQAKPEITPLLPEHTALCCCRRMGDTFFSWAPYFCSFDISEHTWISTMRFVLVHHVAVAEIQGCFFRAPNTVSRNRRMCDVSDVKIFLSAYFYSAVNYFFSGN